MNAVKFILREHAKIRGTFKLIAKLKSGTSKIKRFKDLCRYLIVHETMEEKIFYPFLRKANPDFRPIIKHLVEEEKTAAKAITKLKKIKVSDGWDETLNTKFVKFKDDVDHHASEEENNLLQEVFEQIDDRDLKIIGKKLRAFKNRYYK